MDAPKSAGEIDRRSVVNPVQARVLLKVYATCIDGQDVIARRRVMQALGHPDGA